jgi:hypothetical protein
MNDLLQLMVTRDYGFSAPSGDYRDSEDDIDKARQEYIEYCSIGEDDDNPISYTGKEEIKKIDLDITINNDGLESFSNKDGVPICRVSFSNTSSWIKPKFVIPMHYNTFPSIAQNPEEFEKLVPNSKTLIPNVMESIEF